MYEGKLASSSATTIMSDDIVVVRSVAETTGRILLVMVGKIFFIERCRETATYCCIVREPQYTVFGHLNVCWPKRWIKYLLFNREAQILSMVYDIFCHTPLDITA